MEPFAVNFFIRHKTNQFAFRRLPSVPQLGSVLVFNDHRYVVEAVEWCLDHAATDRGVRINIEMSERTTP